jgi:hypothetical protein
MSSSHWLPFALHIVGMQDAPVSDDLHEEVALDPLSLRGKLCITVCKVITELLVVSVWSTRSPPQSKVIIDVTLLIISTIRTE